VITAHEGFAVWCEIHTELFHKRAHVRTDPRVVLLFVLHIFLWHGIAVEKTTVKYKIGFRRYFI
jgi:hypothetical protein